MCGIAGLINSQFNQEQSLKIAEQMGQAIRHRGPDDHGVWSDSQGTFLIHRRLSILDLSPLGHQPMISQSGRYVIVFNGEIYNFKELREKLLSQGVQFRGHSDTEILLELISREGFEKSLKLSQGMFAIALWDREERKLFLARDRMGEKPLYYGWIGKQFAYASELKSFWEIPGFHPPLSTQAMGLFFKYNYIPSPHSIYEGIFKLSPGHWAVVDPATQEIQTRPYWQYPEPLAEKASVTMTYEEALSQFQQILKRSIQKQMASDVPLGSFLSGGLDSSLVTSVMQENSEQPIRTFTIGFQEKAFDESGYAKDVANHLKCQHTEWILSSADVKSLIPEIPRIYDEPFSDSSQLPTCLLSKMTSQEVTVALSGDGGDELFGGYYRYLWMEKIWQRMQPVPGPLRRAFGQSLGSFREESWQSFYDRTSSFLPLPSVDGFGHKVQKLSSMLSAESPMQAYDLLLSHWHNPKSVLSQDVQLPKPASSLPNRSVIANMMWIDSQNYLPDDLMVKVDRAAMASSLESRAPFLDHELIEFVSGLPLNYKIQGNQSKLLMRSLLRKYVPDHLIDRPKKGFSVPVAQWLREDLKSWAQDLLSAESLSHGLLNNKEIQSRWQEHIQGKRNWGLHLWDVLVFQMWYHHRKNET